MLSKYSMPFVGTTINTNSKTFMLDLAMGWDDVLFVSKKLQQFLFKAYYSELLAFNNANKVQ